MQLRAKYFIAFIVNSNKPLSLPLFPLTPTPTPHLIKAPRKGLFSIVNGQRTKALFFNPHQPVKILPLF